MNKSIGDNQFNQLLTLTFSYLHDLSDRVGCAVAKKNFELDLVLVFNFFFSVAETRALFQICEDHNDQENLLFQLLELLDAQKCVLGPVDLLACPLIYRFVYRSANVL